MLNRVILIGRLVREPQVRYLDSGTALAQFTLAYNRRYRKGDAWQEETSFFDVIAYGKLAERIMDKLNRGELIVVEGRLRQDRWQTSQGEQKSKVRIICENFKVIQKKQETYQEVQMESEENILEKYEDFEDF